MFLANSIVSVESQTASVRNTWRTILAATMCLLALSAVTYAQDADQKDARPAPKPDTLAVFELSGAVTDAPASEDPIFGALGGTDLRQLVNRLAQTADDEKVAAVVLLWQSPSVDTAQLEELRQVIAKVREKKPVYAHTDSLSTGSYALLCSASRLSVSPTGDVWVNGLYGEQLYVRGLLDMIGAQPEFLTCGEYKSAAEMFMRKSASPAAEEMHNWLFDSMYDSVQKMVATSRGVDTAQARAWFDEGLYSAESAKAAKLIDAVETREQLLAHLQEEHGTTIKLDKEYAKDSGEKIDLNNPFAALQIWSEILSGPSSNRVTRNTIAVVHVEGQIMLGKPEASLLGAAEGAYSEVIRKALDIVADEPRIKAVVLRVNSPGGSATASEIILQAVHNVQSKKPVIVSMGGVAGSGGYYVSCRGERIFADATTLTGSIGVVAGKLATEQMWNKIGINFDGTARGKHAGMLRSSEPWSEEEKTELQNWMNEIYGVFKQHVVEGRGNKLTKPIDDLAGGRVYTGAQGLEIGLVDEIGSLDDAIKYAAKKVDLETYEIRSYPRAQNFIEQLAAELNPPKAGDDKRLSIGIWQNVAPLLSELDGPRVRMLQQALTQLDTLRAEKVMLTMPVIQVLER